jgi:5-methyltetrahydrofolate--homocysteine methyltransferase
MEEYEEMREDYYAGLEDRYYLTFDQAKSQRFNIDFERFPPAPTPRKLGRTVIDQVKIADIVPYIDWVSKSNCLSVGVAFRICYCFYQNLILLF